MTGLEKVVADVHAASRVLARMPGHHRDLVLAEMADAIERRADEILRDNRDDVQAAKRAHTAHALIDRLLLDEDRVADMAAGIRAVAALPDPIGLVDGGQTLPNGLDIVRRRVPLGVIAVIYEGRPNVTADAVALSLKSGNAIILRGSHLAKRSNLIIAEVLTGALIEADAPRWSVALLGSDREELRQLIQMEGALDLVIPRGGESLKAFLKEHARVPVIYAASGNNHVYVHADADRRDGRQDHGQLQGAAPRRVQRRRDPARPQGRRAHRAAAGRRAPRRPGRGPAGQPRRARHPRRGRRGPHRGHRARLRHRVPRPGDGRAGGRFAGGGASSTSPATDRATARPS